MSLQGSGKADVSIRRHLLLAAAIGGVLVFGIGGWAFSTELTGAVIAPGLVVVESNAKKVQHPTGGVVGELRVREGDLVRRGDVVLRLDETQTRANLQVIVRQIEEMTARRARLEAERDDADALVFPDELLGRISDPETARVIAGEKRLFEVRQIERQGSKAQLRERISQLREQITGFAGQMATKARESELLENELKGVRELWNKNLVPLSRVASLERDAVRVEGDRSQLIAATAEAKAKIVETELQILNVDQQLRAEVGKELAEIRAKLSELSERRVAAEDQLKRVDLRAPQDGKVFQLNVHTVGGVVTAGEPIMLIVPETDQLRVEARVPPQQIDQVRRGQPVRLRFSAFNQRTTPELNGEVERVSADVTQDEKTNISYYVVRVAIAPGELARLGELNLVPGMPVETFMQTAPRTVISYLVRPLMDQAQRAFRGR